MLLRFPNRRPTHPVQLPQGLWQRRPSRWPILLFLSNPSVRRCAAAHYCDLIAHTPGIGLVTNSNLTLNDQVSGIFGLGFPRLSSISKATNSTPFFTTLAYKGLLDYPLFALSLAKNGTGSLTLGECCPSIHISLFISCVHIGRRN